MARRKDRQLRLFGVGDLGPDPGEDSSQELVGPEGEPWEPLMRDLGRMLARGGFEAYLARRPSADPGTDGRRG